MDFFSSLCQDFKSSWSSTSYRVNIESHHNFFEHHNNHHRQDFLSLYHTWCMPLYWPGLKHSWIRSDDRTLAMWHVGLSYRCDSPSNKIKEGFFFYNLSLAFRKQNTFWIMSRTDTLGKDKSWYHNSWWDTWWPRKDLSNFMLSSSSFEWSSQMRRID